MTTAYNINQEVYVRGRVEAITADSDGVTYKVALPSQKTLNTPKIEVTEGDLISCEVEDFVRENPI